MCLFYGYQDLEIPKAKTMAGQGANGRVISWISFSGVILLLHAITVVEFKPRPLVSQKDCCQTTMPEFLFIPWRASKAWKKNLPAFLMSNPNPQPLHPSLYTSLQRPIYPLQPHHPSWIHPRLCHVINPHLPSNRRSQIQILGHALAISS